MPLQSLLIYSSFSDFINLNCNLEFFTVPVCVNNATNYRDNVIIVRADWLSFAQSH